MVKINISKERCKGCELCIINCPKGNITLSANMNKKGVHYAIVDAEKCNACGICFQMCPDICIEIEK